MENGQLYQHIHRDPCGPVTTETGRFQDRGYRARAFPALPRKWSRKDILVRRPALYCLRKRSRREEFSGPDRACLPSARRGRMLFVRLPRPIKQTLPDYQATENRLLSVIYEKFLGSDLTEEESRIVKEIDDALLWYDLKVLLGLDPPEAAPELHFELSYEVQPFADVENEYLSLYYRCSGAKIPKKD